MNSTLENAEIRRTLLTVGILLIGGYVGVNLFILATIPIVPLIYAVEVEKIFG